ncbi:hypothetical protein ACQ4PT_064118 [Festuca glaucescens]
MDMEEEESRIDLSSLTVVDDDDADEITTENDSEDEYDTSTDEDESSTEEEDDGDGDAGPPIHFAEDLASPPGSILLDIRGYIDVRTNATTANACLSTGRRAIRVTFWAARPPRVSCFTIHCDGVKPNQFPSFPLVLAAADDLVLLRVAINPSENPFSTRFIIEYYIYQAAGATPTLRLLTVPCHLSYAGILRLRDGDDGEFLVASIQVVEGANGKQFDLHLFDSRTWTWTTRLMRVDKPERYARAGFRPTKMLTVGGERGLMAWVDLWHGMLFCDLLAVHDDDAMLRYIPLPSSPSTKREGSPSDVRDIAIVQGRIKFFEMRFKVKQRAITSTTTLVTRYWKATTWQMTDPWHNWRNDCGLNIFKMPVDKTHPELPPRLHDMGKLHGDQPALSLHEKDVVYIMAKAKGSDRRAWMLAVDVRKKTLREVVAFDAGRAYNFTYLQSRISNYLRIQSSTR